MLNIEGLHFGEKTALGYVTATKALCQDEEGNYSIVPLRELMGDGSYEYHVSIGLLASDKA